MPFYRTYIYKVGGILGKRLIMLSIIMTSSPLHFVNEWQTWSILYTIRLGIREGVEITGFPQYKPFLSAMQIIAHYLLCVWIVWLSAVVSGTDAVPGPGPAGDPWWPPQLRLWEVSPLCRESRPVSGLSAAQLPAGLVWFGLVWCGVVWCGLVWFSLVWLEYG